MLLANDVLGSVPGLVRVQPAGRSIRYGLGTNHHPSLCSERWTARKNQTDSPYTMDEARKVAKAVLHAANGLYTEVDICNADGTIERIQDSAVFADVGAI